MCCRSISQLNRWFSELSKLIPNFKRLIIFFNVTFVNCWDYRFKNYFGIPPWGSKPAALNAAELLEYIEIMQLLTDLGLCRIKGIMVRWARSEALALSSKYGQNSKLQCWDRGFREQFLCWNSYWHPHWYLVENLLYDWGCSSAGRAHDWQSWGQGFEPPQLHY